MSATRREARERALGLLYEAETRSVPSATVLDEQPIAPDPYTVALVTGVGDTQDAIDDTIRRYAKGWKLERMPALDRAVLRLAIHELTAHPEVPTGAVISEAVDLAAQYSTDESGRFVNGMLSRIAGEVRPPS